MSATWTSGTGIVLRDRVPATLRRRWVEQGHCPGRDLYALFSEHVRAHPQRAAVVDAAGTIDYADLDTLVRRIAAALADAGCGRRDIIGIEVPNGRRAVAAELAVAAIGAVALPYPAGRGRRDSFSLLGRSRATGAIVVDVAREVPLAATLAGLRPGLPALRTVFVFGAAPDGCRSLDPWLADAGADRRWRPAPVDPEAPARILVSSGSEAEPKMVAYSHNAMAGGRGNYVGVLHGGSLPMRNLVLVPLASSFGSLGTVTLARHGGTVLVLDAFDPAAALLMITEHRPTHVFGVPTMLRRMADQPQRRGEDTSSLCAIVASGAALHASAIEACRARFGCTVINVYGSADGVNCHTAKVDLAPGATHLGRPDPTVADIRIADARGRPAAAGQEGEIWALGPMTPLCYVNAPELDARYRPSGGWVRTGDRGLIDPDGYLRVVGRIKQIIIRGGYNISPAEIERQLNLHPVIAEAACVAVPDPDVGERLCVCVVQQPGTPPLTLTEINTFLENERSLERRKLPELLVALPELPLGPTGKVCRQTLTQIAVGQHRSSEGP